jgi:hypothetical protein
VSSYRRIPALALERLLSGAQIIIVGVDNTDRRMDEYTYSKDPTYGGGEGDHYLDFLEKTVGKERSLHCDRSRMHRTGAPVRGCPLPHHAGA